MQTVPCRGMCHVSDISDVFLIVEGVPLSVKHFRWLNLLISGLHLSSVFES